MSMFSYAEMILGVMVAVYVLARVFTPSTELSMLAAAIAGALAGGFGFPYRHIAEGAITYIDINLIFITATLFMNILKESGGVAFVVRAILRRFHRNRPLLLLLLAVSAPDPGRSDGSRQRDGADRRAAWWRRFCTTWGSRSSRSPPSFFSSPG